MLCCNLIHCWSHLTVHILLIYPSAAFWKRLAETIEFLILDSVLSGEIDFLAGDSSLNCRGEDFLNRYVFDHFKKIEKVIITFANVDFLAQGVTFPGGISLLARSGFFSYHLEESILQIIT
jgi:hypothetical protein